MCVELPRRELEKKSVESEGSPEVAAEAGDDNGVYISQFGGGGRGAWNWEGGRLGIRLEAVCAVERAIAELNDRRLAMLCVCCCLYGV